MWEFFYLKGFDFSMERLHGGKLNRKFIKSDLKARQLET